MYNSILDDINLTSNMKLLFDSIDSKLLTNIINNEHYSFATELNSHKTTDDTLQLNILVDIKNHKDEQTNNITDIVHKLNKTLAKSMHPSFLTGCCFTPSYERTDTYNIQTIYYYKCINFDTAHNAVKLILPSMSEIEFSKLHENFKYSASIDKGLDGLLYKKEKKVYDRKHTLLTIYISDVDIISNMSIWQSLFTALSNVWM